MPRSSLFRMILILASGVSWIAPFSVLLPTTSRRRSSTTKLGVFDFFKQRSSEGFQQLSNLANASFKGELGRGLQEAAAYTSSTNKAFTDGLALSRQRLLRSIESLLQGVDPEKLISELEDILLQADLGAQTTDDILQEIESLRQDSKSVLNKDDLMSILRGKLLEALEVSDQSRVIQLSQNPRRVPTVLFVMGANGMGKTTTVGKLAHRLRTEGNQTVLLAACDTFRAGAVDQLQQWAHRAQVDIIRPTERAKTPAAVLYSTLDEALARSVDVVIVDTSGRLSNNDDLTQELAKMKRVIQKRLSIEKDADGKSVPNLRVPHETLLVLDAAQGRMALDSARTWNHEIGLTGLILTKLDGSARGGSVVAVSRDLQLPVKLIGVGEGIEDLKDFDPELFVDSLLGIGQAGGGQTELNEGLALTERLKSMRKERDTRAKELALSGKKVTETLLSHSSLTPTPVQSRITKIPSRSKSSKKKRRNMR